MKNKKIRKNGMMMLCLQSRKQIKKMQKLQLLSKAIGEDDKPENE